MGDGIRPPLNNPMKAADFEEGGMPAVAVVSSWMEPENRVFLGMLKLDPLHQPNYDLAYLEMLKTRFPTVYDDALKKAEKSLGPAFEDFANIFGSEEMLELFHRPPLFPPASPD